MSYFPKKEKNKSFDNFIRYFCFSNENKITKNTKRKEYIMIKLHYKKIQVYLLKNLKLKCLEKSILKIKVKN